MGDRKYCSLREIQQFTPFDKKTAEGIVNMHFIAPYESIQVDGDLKFTMGDWLKARRKYLMRQPNSWNL